METKVHPNLVAKVHPNLEAKVYPDLETMCRLCLKENAGAICVFPKEKSSDKLTGLSIPMRIMACAALEVQDSDHFPKKICTECRFQLEKSYYFRKMSQASDAKLRKHMRLVGMGKTSRVFNKTLEEDQEDELEFQDSLDFINAQEELRKQVEKLKIDSFLNEMKLRNEQEMKLMRDNLKRKCREELIPIIKEELEKELRIEIQNELEENLRKEITEECTSHAKESLRCEAREECRQLDAMLDNLQTYVNNKKKILNEIIPTTESDAPSSPVASTENIPKIKCISQNLTKGEDSIVLELHDETENINDDINMNDEECDSEGNFLIYNIGRFASKNKSSDDKIELDTEQIVQEAEYEDEEFADSNIIMYEKIDENIYSNLDSGETTSTTSYRIEEDKQDGEIQFLKKMEDSNSNDVDDESPESQNENIMVIKIGKDFENEFEEQCEEVKHTIRKESSIKTRKSYGKKAQTSTVTTNMSLNSETTFFTKTYVNPFQRSTNTAKVFKCDDCPMVFSTKLSLERHLRTHKKVEKTGIKFQCPECRIVVSCSSALRRHMYVHCEEKPFTCSECNKSFVQKEILKRHMQTHTGIKPHQCPHCERAFAQRINLTQHINRNHLKEPRIQQHSCHLCPKRFNHASGLSRHLATHNGVAYHCSECNRTFSDPSSINRHVMNIHGGNGSRAGNKRSCQ